MEEVKKLLEEREKKLLQIKLEKEKALQHIVQGTLRISDSGNSTKYYHRRNTSDRSGVYIPEKERDIARKLAQKEYDCKILGAVNKELKVIKKYLVGYPDMRAEQLYEKLHKERQKLIIPIEETEEQYLMKWQDYSYQGKGFDENVPEYFSDRGERVRSKSELIIADLLNKEFIPYRYECPICLNGMGKIYPDFTVLNVKKRKEYYWEHFGMMDDPAYVEKALQKIAAYELNGIFPGEGLLITYESRKNPLNQKVVKGIIHHYLK